MKIIYILAVLMSLSTLSTAQSNATTKQAEVIIADASEQPKANDQIKTKKEYTFSAAHNQTVIKQITAHLGENIEYPTALINNGVEGMVVIAVSISKEGKILQSKVVKSPHAEFDTAVLKAMEKIKTINLLEQQYRGVPTVYVPVNFSIGQ